MKRVFTPEANGYLASNLVGMAIIAANKYLLQSPNSAGGTFIFSEFVIIPMLMGIIAAWFWRPLELTGRAAAGKSVINACLGIFLSSIFMGEGVVCLIIVSPLVLAFVMGGTFIGRAMFGRNNQKLNVSIVGLLLAVFVVDSVSEHHYENMVSDSITINAPATEVWKHVVAFPRIKEKNKYWLFRVGMPSPVESTVDGYYLGAGRKCIFSNGYTFDEKITTYDENHNLTFAVTNQPRDPEIMGHIDIKQGQFLLHDNGNGTTTLTGNSWYRLYVFPTWYYDTWAQSITRNVHLRVMEHIKELSEPHPNPSPKEKGF
ncbi:MAG: SRPBCC family protein [Mucilaginibacter sp.]